MSPEIDVVRETSQFVVMHVDVVDVCLIVWHQQWTLQSASVMMALQQRDNIPDT